MEFLFYENVRDFNKNEYIVKKRAFLLFIGFWGALRLIPNIAITSSKESTAYQD